MIITILNARSITLEIFLMSKLRCSMMKIIKSIYRTPVKLLLFLVIFITLIGYLILYNWSIPCEMNNDLVIPRGASLPKVIQILEETTCFEDNGVLKFLMIVTRNDKEVRPGRYNLRDIRSIGQLMTRVTTNSKEMTKVTILEGWTMRQTSRKMHEVLKLDTLEFISLCNDRDFIEGLNIGNPKNLEGYLFPETYSFPSNRIMFDLDEREVISLLLDQFKSEYKEKVGSNHILSIHEILTLASIIQGECVFADEMGSVSSVYNNRLEKNWLLQADPTIQYLKPGKNKRLYNKDYKRFNSPYNTYLHKGLPPGPISSPGIDAIQAAAYPEETEYMFFVAKGDNRHHFSKTEDEHNEAKRKYLKKLW